MFRGARLSVLESEVSESGEFDTVTDEFRRWGRFSETECQKWVGVEDGVRNEFKLMCQLCDRYVSCDPCIFVFSSGLCLT